MIASTNKRPIEKPLTGLVFAISGSLSIPRAKFEAFLCQHGGSVVKSVTNTCTHLITTETDTKKCQDAKEKGIVVVDEDWVRHKVEGKASAASSTEAGPVSSDKTYQGVSFEIHRDVKAESRGELERMIAEIGGSLLSTSTPAAAEEGKKVLVVSADTIVVTEDHLRNAVIWGRPLFTSPAAPTGSSLSGSSSTTSFPFLSSTTGAQGASLGGATSTGGLFGTAVTAASSTVISASAPAAAPPTAKTAGSKSSKPLQGMTICITGTLSVPRAEFERLIVSHGGKTAKSVTGAVTHLVVASLEERETKKCKDAEAKGIQIIDEDTLREMMEGGERASSSSTSVHTGEAVGDLHPIQAFVPVHQPFRPDRATIHLYSAEGDEDDEEEAQISKADLRKLKPFLRRGDLLENVAESGYRSSGVCIYDGKNVTDLYTELDDYGSLGPEYVVFRDFNPCYWDYESMNVNNMLVPDVDSAQSCWHTGEFPSCHIDRTAILEADGLNITMFGKTYTIPQEFKDWVVEHANEPGPIDHEDMIYVDGMTEGAGIILL